MYQNPIIYFQDNLIFRRDKSCWAVFKIQGGNYEFSSNSGQIQYNWQLANFLGGISSYAQLHIIPVEQNIEQHYDKILSELDTEDSLYPKAKIFFEKKKQYLKKRIQANAEANDYRNFICVKLQMSSNELDLMKEAVTYFIKDPINAVNTWLSLDTRDILESKIEEYKQMAKDWFEQQKEVMYLTNATKKETQWLLKRMAYRGMPENKINLWYEDENQEACWQPKAKKSEGVLHPEKTIVNLFDGKLIPKKRYLEIETEEGTSYQSFLVMSHFPDQIKNPGKEWIYKLQKRQIKPEICIQFEAIDSERALKKVGGKQQEIESQADHVMLARARVPQDLKDGARQGIQLETVLTDSREPILVSTIQFCIASESLQDMNARANQLRNFLRGWQFAIERPVIDQTKLFINFIPSVTGAVKGYAMPLTPLAAASGIFGVTHSIGDYSGDWIGSYGRMKVFLNLAEACLNDKSAAACFFGNPGVGKSYNANYLIVLHILMGAYGLILDPKGERAHWVKKFALLKDHINLINIGLEEENRGVLDPYNIYHDDIETATELATDTIEEMCKIQHGTHRYTVLKEAAAKMKNGDRKPCMHSLTVYLDEWEKTDSYYEDAKDLARLIRVEKEVGMGQLLYGYGEEKTIHLDNRLNIVQIQNLTLPERNTKREDFNSKEIMSSVIIMILAQFAKKFALKNKDRIHKIFQVILFDESWMLSKTKQGISMYDYLGRMGRSLFTAPIFNGHSVDDISDEAIRNTITYRFCFCTNDDGEAERMLRFLGLEVSQKNITMMKNLPNGGCMFQDADKRVGRLQFEVPFKELDEIFDTTPKKKKIGDLLEKEVI